MNDDHLPSPASGSAGSRGRPGGVPHRRTWRFAALVSLALAGFAAMFTWGMAPAAAHAMLLSTDPGTGATVAKSPEQVVLRFSEEVRGSSGALRVFDGKGFRIDRGAADFAGDTVSVGVPPLADGTYVVSWRVESADSIPVSGAFTFSVGEPSDVAPGLVARYDSSNNQNWEIAGTVSRWIAYAGLLLACGGVLFLLLVHDGTIDRARLSWTTTAAATIGMAGAAATIPVHAALASGLGVKAIGGTQAFNDTVAGRVGFAAGLAGLGALLIAVPVAWFMMRTTPMGRMSLASSVLGCLAVLTGLVLVGHSTATTPRLLVLASDFAHLGAAAIWVGGLVLLTQTLRNRAGDDPTAAAGMVARFSTLAAGALAVVAVSGLTLAWSEVRSFGGLTSTTYGQALLAKLAVVAVVVAIAAFNRFRLVPAVAARRTTYWEEAPAAGAGADQPVGRRQPRANSRSHSTAKAAMTHLRRTLAYEVIGVVVILGITAALTNITPARTAAESKDGFIARTALGDGQLDLTVDPSRVGRSAINLYLYDDKGQQADVAENVMLELSLPARDIGPVDREPVRAGEGHYTITVDDLSIAGEWQITVVARTTSSDEERATIAVPIT